MKISSWRRAAMAAVVSLAGAAHAQQNGVSPEFAWPESTMENRLWTRWWWLGDAVDRENLTKQLEAFHQAGLGGVEICPIYGAYGQEPRYIQFLSPPWVEMLAHTSRETRRLGMGLDLTTGTGWPFGGKNVTDEDASNGITIKEFDHYPTEKEIGERHEPDTEKAVGNVVKLICLMGMRPDGGGVQVAWPRDSTEAIPEGMHFLAVIQTRPLQKVKRAAPGAEGNVLDPYSTRAMERYLGEFDRAFEGMKNAGAALPRAEFHDSFEYYGASWTDDFFAQFQKRRGYDLHTQLAALGGEGPDDLVSRVKCDYRETLSDLHLAYMERWVDWSHSHGELARNQAHGGPGNLLDNYAAVDIPECEIFHLYEEGHLPFLKLASSAAHVTGKRLSSSESFTWLDEHFTASWAEVKPAADFLFLAGVNHMFLHGIPYSPEDAAWPGWQFYASVNFGPRGGLWNEMPAFAAYVTRCQSVLQSGRPGNDVLLYVPFHEFWSDPANNDKLMIQFTTPGLWMKPYAFYSVATTLWDKGAAYDEVSDKLLAGAAVRGGEVSLGNGDYRVILVPQSPSMPVETVRKLLELARAGAKVDFQDEFPQDVPGLGDLEKRRAELRSLRAGLDFEDRPDGTREAKIGSGLVRVGPLASLLPDTDSQPMTAGLKYVRRLRDDGVDYFVTNTSKVAVEGWQPLRGEFASAVILDPREADRSGLARLRTSAASGNSAIFLQLQPGESRIVRAYTRELRGPAWRYTQPAGEPAELQGHWSVQFMEGGPFLPQSFNTGKLASWTELGDQESKRLAGTARYTLEFEKPAGSGDESYELDLGKVGDWARVTLNGKLVGDVWAAPFRVRLGGVLRAGKNRLQIDVTNVAANRVRDMDARGVQWRTFRDVNVVTTGYTRFDASEWPVREAGLMGPVTLIPVKAFDPQP